MTTPPRGTRRALFPASVSRPVVNPIQPSVVYSSESPDQLEGQYEGKEHGYTYSREGHPNADLLAAKIDMLEGGQGGIICASGMAAVGTALMGLLSQGDHVIGGDQLYGRSLRMMTQDLPRFGIATTLVDTGDVAAVAAAIRPNTRMITINFPHNPTGAILSRDRFDALVELCRKHGISDATFYKWRAKYGGMDASLMARLKELEDENRRLKKMYAELSMQNDLLKEALGKKR